MDRRSPIDAEAADPDAGWLATVMHVAFFVLLCSSLTRYLIVHPGAPTTPWVIVLALALALLYVLGPVLGPQQADGRQAPAGTASRVWLAAVIGVWFALVVLAPSFGWCVVPLLYTSLRSLRTRSAIVLVALITLCVVGAQLKLRLRFGFDPNLMFAPFAGAAVATAVFVHSQRQADRLRAVIIDLVRTRRELAATERREGTLAERQRLSMEIHDTLAQGLSSQQMLLQAADRLWDTDPAAARRHIRTAESVAEHNLAEARRFVHDLARPTSPEAAASKRPCAPSRSGSPPRPSGSASIRTARPPPFPTAYRRPCCGSPRARWPTSANTPTPARRR